jgi:hypothetical protein
MDAAGGRGDKLERDLSLSEFDTLSIVPAALASE